MGEPQLCQQSSGPTKFQGNKANFRALFTRHLPINLHGNGGGAIGANESMAGHCNMRASAHRPCVITTFFLRVSLFFSEGMLLFSHDDIGATLS